MSIFVKIFENLDFSETFRRISISIFFFKKTTNTDTIFENLNYTWIFKKKISILVKIFEKYRFQLQFA